jgi:integrase/recombinase XerD
MPVKTKPVRDLIRPISKPSAQYATLCDHNTGRSYLTEAVLKAETTIRNHGNTLWFFMHFLATSGCRVSEVIKISPRSIAQNGSVIIEGSKGSNSRIVTDLECRDFFLRCKRLSVYPFSYYSRFFIYRFMKKMGFTMVIEGHKKMAVTHSLRHEYIQSMKSIDSDLEATKRAIGHKSMKSTEHYANGKVRKNSN